MLQLLAETIYWTVYCKFEYLFWKISLSAVKTVEPKENWCNDNCLRAGLKMRT